MLKYKPLVNLQGRLQRGEQGSVQSGNLEVYFNKGRLINVKAGDDAIWLLRRMVVTGYLAGSEASKMINIPELQSKFLFSVPKEIFQVYALERAKHNLFRWSHCLERPVFSGCVCDQGPLQEKDADELLAEAWVWRERLRKWYQKMASIWVYSLEHTEELAFLSQRPQPLRKVVLQSPLEEVYTLEKIDQLHRRKQLIVGDSAADILGEATEDEQELFQDVESEYAQGKFQISQELLEQITLARQDSFLWSSKDSFELFVQELNAWFRTLDVVDSFVHRCVQEEGWKATVFTSGQWQIELLWRGNCIQRQVFVDILFRWIRMKQQEDWLPQIDTWVRKWV